MAEVWSLGDGERMVGKDGIPQKFVVKALDSVKDAGGMVKVFGASPGCEVENIDALVYVEAVAGSCKTFLRAARKICGKRRISPSHKNQLFQAHDNLAALNLPQDATVKVLYRPRRRRRLHAARVLRFLPNKVKKVRSKSMGGLVVALRRRIHKIALKIGYSRYLTARLKKILKWEARVVHKFLHRSVLFRSPEAA